MHAPITVDIWSDIACPWCFIGKRRFERAVAEYDGEVTVEYHSFELAPDTPVDYEGSEVDFLADYKGLPKDQVRQMLAHVTQVAAQEGLRFDYDALRHTKTLLAHQAIHHAKAYGKQSAMVERLFSAYFEQGRHVGRVTELVELAAEVGLDPEQTREALTDGRYADAVANDIAMVRRLGITGVPFYVIGGKYGVSGAQDSAVFLEALRLAAADAARDAASPESDRQPAGEAR